MGFFSSLFGSDGPDGRVDGPGTYEIEVVGESNYQDAIRRVCGDRCGPDGVDFLTTALLILEDDNQYDGMAVKVTMQGRTVGYLSRENARQYRRELKRIGYPRLRGTCDARIRGGFTLDDGEEAMLGIRLDLPAVG